VGQLYLTSLSSSKQALHSFKENMAPKNATLQPSKKEIIEFSFKGFANANIAFDNRSIGLIIKSTTMVLASIHPKTQQVVAPTFQSHKTQNLGSTFPAYVVNQTACFS